MGCSSSCSLSLEIEKCIQHIQLVLEAVSKQNSIYLKYDGIDFFTSQIVALMTEINGLIVKYSIRNKSNDSNDLHKQMKSLIDQTKQLNIIVAIVNNFTNNPKLLHLLKQI